MAIQTEYLLDPIRALSGNIERTSVADTDSKIAEGNIKFGRAVVAGTNAKIQVKTPVGATPKFLGVAVRDLARENFLDGEERTYYKEKDTLSILRSGYINVEIEAPVSIGDPVFYRHTAGAGGTELGIFRNDDDTATCAEIKGARFEFAGDANSVVVIYLPAYSQ